MVEDGEGLDSWDVSYDALTAAGGSRAGGRGRWNMEEGGGGGDETRRRGEVKGGGK